MVGVPLPFIPMRGRAREGESLGFWILDCRIYILEIMILSTPNPLLSGERRGLSGSLPFAPVRGRAREGESDGCKVLDL